jgi:alcohol dehydrogenase (cytochrome c)
MMSAVRRSSLTKALCILALPLGLLAASPSLAVDAAAAGAKPASTGATTGGTITNFKPVDAAALSGGAKMTDWPILRGNYQGWGYSPLSQINKSNVKTLQLVWSRTMEPGSNEGSAIEYNGVVYLGNTNDVVQAINAETGDLIWEYRRKLPPASKFINTLGQTKRSVALYGDKVYFVSWDNYVVALDAKSGQLAWETNRGQGVQDGVTNSSGPIVVDGVVIAGATCQYSGFGCYVTGTDANSGEELWRNTFIPKPGEKGDDTWGGAPYENRWMTGMWGQITYDPENDIVFYGSSGAGPASETQRGTPGGTLYGTDTRFAVKPKTGEIIWRHQTLPRDNWDSECTFDMMVIDSKIDPAKDMDGLKAIGKDVPTGQTRKVLTGVPCKTGLMWQFDAKTGQFFWARDTVTENSVASIDNTGLVTVNEDMILKQPGKTYNYCPTFLGGRDWPSGAYDPKQNLYLIPLSNACYDVTPRTTAATPLDVYNEDAVLKLAPGKTKMGRIDAIDVATGKTKWSFEMTSPLYDPVLTTGGGLVFTGGQDRYIRAIDLSDGKEIWKSRLPGAASGYTTTYEVNGRQYVAIVAGGSLVGPSFKDVAADIDMASGANGVYVFALPEK